MNRRDEALHLQAIQRLADIIIRETNEDEENATLLRWLGKVLLDEGATLGLVRFEQ